MPAVEPLVIESTDGVQLEAELARPAAPPTRRVVLCHPHPQYGGTMRSIVIGALFEALPTVGVLTLRFNFRGVERSTGAHDDGPGEREDARAAVRTIAGLSPTPTPLTLVGWSFGADVALSVLDAAVADFVAIAPPLRLVADLDAVGHDPRGKLLVLGEHDEVCPTTRSLAITAGWTNTTAEIIPGASHFFVGRTDYVTRAVATFVAG